MKNILWIVYLLFLTISAGAQVDLPVYADSVFSTYYQQRVTHFGTLPQTRGDIIFLGNSITDGAEWDELLNNSHIKNRGISGDITAGVISRLDEVTNRKPAKVFLLIGTNDLARNIAPDSVVKNILLIAAYIHQQTPATELYVQSILPVNDVYKKFSTHTDKTVQINNVNAALQLSAAEHYYTYIDIHTSFCDEHGKMKASLTNDGLHLKGEGYLLWKHLIYPYVFGLQPKPALLPLPCTLKWTSGYFQAYKCHTIVADEKLQKEKDFLQKELAARGIQITNSDTGNYKLCIELHLEKVQAQQLAEEVYHLKVTSGKVIITANAPQGIFNGIQTLMQLLRDNVVVDNCDITDWPAFTWRGYMVDVGRNFQSVGLLKQQIDQMALYKLNVFHLHLTEDIAWRLYIKQYPQLTDPANMLRDKGQYYTPEDLRELINYCEERHIEFIPEIDMPGHSAAFKRVFKIDMQSEAGVRILKSILMEVCNTYHFKYLHIGADEVKITNPNFLRGICRFLGQFKIKIIGWNPGGDLPLEVIRQLWMKDGATDSKLKYIDSRHLYLNHMDPLESVITIFNRRIGDKDHGDKSLLGGEICVWNDRAVTRQEDVLLMNPVYPAMLAFAERSWRGGGRQGWTSVIGAPGTPGAIQFTEFEVRLSDQKQQNFKELPFPYQKQVTMVWNFYGPYKNNAGLDAKFEPESKDVLNDNAVFQATGGTIILRHWWYPLVKGVIDNPQENNTWYAKTKIWSDTCGYKNFWIGFNNLSRSYATDAPEPGTWDNRKSAVWVNGILIAPPNWKHAGEKGNMEIPLVDEGYEYRQPTHILLKKGWNTILVKLPSADFKGTDWGNPVKWMFTFLKTE